MQPMSIEHLEPKEEARYLIGEAIMRRILKSERSPDVVAEILIALRWIEAWLTPEELHTVITGTGMLFDDELADELQGDIVPFDGKDDDIPF